MVPEQKCVMLIDEALPIGLIANTTAILGATLGKEFPNGIGAAVYDSNNQEHLGIVNYPIPILKSSEESLSTLRTVLNDERYSSLTVIGFSNIAQTCGSYELYTEKMKNTAPEQIHYYGLCLHGSKKLVNKLTGSLPLLR